MHPLPNGKPTAAQALPHELFHVYSLLGKEGSRGHLLFVS